MIKLTFYNLECKNVFTHYFIHYSIICERFVNPDVLKNFDLDREFDYPDWMIQTRFQGMAHKEVIRLFYANMDSRNIKEFSFETKVYGKIIEMDLEKLARNFIFRWVENPIVFPIHEVDLDNLKGEMTHRLCRRSLTI